MAYLGRQPLVGNYQVLDALTATTTATYALTKNSVAVFPQTPANCIVSLNGVIQAPFDSYTISGSNIVFASALTGSDSIDFITVLGDVLNVGTVSDGTIGLAKLSATGTKDATTFLRGDNTFQTIGTNTPAFSAISNGVQSISLNTYTKLDFGTELFDTDNTFSSSTFTVPSGGAGKYFFSAQGGLQCSANYFEWNILLYLNGSAISEAQARLRTEGAELNAASAQRLHIAHILDLSESDYLEVYGYIDASSGTAQANSGQSGFRGYKIIE